MRALNQIFGFIGPIIRMHGGYIDKYNASPGGVEAIFMSAKRAMNAAMELEQAVKIFNSNSSQASAFQSIPTLYGTSTNNRYSSATKQYSIPSPSASPMMNDNNTSVMIEMNDMSVATGTATGARQQHLAQQETTSSTSSAPLPALSSFNVQITSIVMGIHTSKSSLIGTIGEIQRMEGAIMSPTSVIAQNLKALAKKLKAKVLISKESLAIAKKHTAALTGNSSDSVIKNYRYMGNHTIATEHESFTMKLYEMVSESDSVKLKACKEFSSAVHLMENGCTDEAAILFKQISDSNDADQSAQQFYMLCNVLFEDSVIGSKNLKVKDVLVDAELRDAFKRHLVQEFSHENLLLWEQAEQLLQLHRTEINEQEKAVVTPMDPQSASKAKEIAHQMCRDFFAADSKFEINLSVQTIHKFRSALFNHSNHDNSAEQFQQQSLSLIDVLTSIQWEAEALMIDSCKRFIKTPIVKVLLSKKSVPMNKSAIVV